MFTGRLAGPPRAPCSATHLVYRRLGYRSGSGRSAARATAGTHGHRVSGPGRGRRGEEGGGFSHMRGVSLDRRFARNARRNRPQ
jgi:hypothetical protein